MQDLRNFITKHCQQVPLGQGGNDVAFFGVKVINDPNPDALRELVQSHKDGEFGTHFDLFDGKEHSYLNLGAWIGDQGLALMMMALGDHLKVWQLLTPEKLLPGIPEELKMQMVQQGMISIIYSPNN